MMSLRPGGVLSQEKVIPQPRTQIIEDMSPSLPVVVDVEDQSAPWLEEARF